MTTDRVPLVRLDVVNTREIRACALQRMATIAQFGEFIDGPEVAIAESKFAEHVGAAHCVLTANGTDSIELACRALYGTQETEALVVPSFTFIGTLEGVLRAGERVRICDVAEATLMAPAADIAVGIFGQDPGPGAPILDAAQMHGVRVGGRLATWSGYVTKNLGAWGDAGAVTTDDENMAEWIRAYARHGDRGRIGPGMNSRCDTVQAAVLIEKLNRLDEWVEARRQAAGQYRRRLRGMGLDIIGDESSAFHLAVTRVQNRAKVREAMAVRGVETGVHYPLALSEFGWLEAYGIETDPCPVAELAASEVLSLPLWPGIPTSTIDRVVNALGESIGVAGEG